MPHCNKQQLLHCIVPILCRFWMLEQVHVKQAEPRQKKRGASDLSSSKNVTMLEPFLQCAGRTCLITELLAMLVWCMGLRFFACNGFVLPDFLTAVVCCLSH